MAAGRSPGAAPDLISWPQPRGPRNKSNSEDGRAMTENGKKTELRRITADLEHYVASYCGSTGGKASDFSDEKCHDAALMLRDALDRLDQEG